MRSLNPTGHKRGFRAYCSLFDISNALHGMDVDHDEISKVVTLATAKPMSKSEVLMLRLHTPARLWVSVR